MSERAAPSPTESVSAPRESAQGALACLAPALGLAASEVDLRLDREGDRLLADAGARGAARGNVVWLRGYDPASEASRLTLAHELVHVAQGRLHSATPPSPLAAEREAERLAATLLGGGMAPRPRAATGGALHFDGAEPPPARSLEDVVEANYRDEREDMVRLLAQETPSADAVTRVLDLLAPLPFETARVLAAQLGTGPLAALANGLGDDHARSHRREVLAAAESFTTDMLDRADNGHRIFRAMRLDPGSLSPAEHHAAVTTLRRVPIGQLTRLEGGDNGADLRALRTTALPEYDREEAGRRAARTEAGRRAAAPDLTRREEDLRRTLSIMLTDASREDAREALRLLAENPALAVPDPRFSGAPTPAPDAALPPLPESSLQSVIARLDGAGIVDRWIGALEPVDRRGETPEARGFAMLVRTRRPDRTMARMRTLLSRSFFDWAVRDWEASLAWDMLRAMPPAEQARFQSLDEGRLYLRLIEELPDDLRAEAAMAGLIVVRGEDGSLSDLTAEAGALLEGQAELIAAARAFDDSAEAAYRLFVRLAALAVPAPAHAPPEGTAPASTRSARGLSVLQAVVRRLDVLGLMRRLFSALSDGVKQDRRYWNDLATVLGARDPAFNREDLRRLLHVSTFLWIITIDEVTFEEALFAFHILRALPEDQRRAFELEDRGAYAARIAGALSQSMLHEAGLSFAFTRPDERGETPLRRQLADPAAWDGTNPADLALLVQMGITAGDFDWIFEQSHRQRAWTREALGPLVERFALYDPRVGRTFPRPHTVSAARSSRHLLAMLFGTGAYELEEYTRPVHGTDPFTGEPATYAETTGLRVTVDLEQLEGNAGAPLYTGAVLARSPGERISIGSDNREAALAQPNVVDIEINEPAGFMRVRASRIALTRFASVSTGSTLRAGAVSLTDLDFAITFAPEDLRAPRAGRFHVDDVSLDEIVHTRAGDAEPTGLRHLGIAGVDASASFQTAPLPDSPVLGHVLGLLWDLALNRDALTERAAANTSLGTATISVGRIDAQGLHMGDLRVASLSVEGFTAAAGGNRAAALRAQIFVLDARIEQARAAAPEQVAGLVADREELRPRLAALELLEAEMLGLMARLQAGHRLSAAEQARLDTLQAETGVGGVGGLSIAIARVSVDGVDGPVRLGHAELTGIRGGGDTAALAFRQMTSEEAIRRFVSAGPPSPARLGTAASGPSVSADDLTLRDLALPATIPTLAAIEAQLRADPPLLPAEHEHLLRLRPLVGRYEELRSRSLGIGVPEGLARSPQDQRELLEVSRQLGELLDIRVREVTVTGPTISAGGGEAFSARIGASSVAVRGIHGAGITEREGQALTLSGVGAGVRVATDGLHVEGLVVRQLDLQALDYNNGTHHIWTDGLSTARDITADILLRRRTGENGGIDFRNIHIETFRIGRIEGSGLGYEKLVAGSSSYRVEITSGALLGLALRGFEIDLGGEETRMSGAIEVAGFDQMRFRFAMGRMLEADGQLDRPEGAERAPRAVSIDMASDGTMTIALDALVASDTDVTYRGADGRSGGGMHITRGDVSGQVVLAGGDTRINALRLDSLTFSRIRWHTADGTTIRADGPTVATGVRFSGRYSSLADERSEFAIDSLHVDRISAARIVVDAGSLHLELPEAAPGGRFVPGEAATLSDINVHNLLIGLGGAATTIGPTAGAARARGSIGSVETDFLVRYGEQLRASGMLNAGRIDFAFDPGGAIEGRATGISGAGTVHYGDGTGPGVDLGYGFRNFDTGLIRYSGNVVSIGANGSAPLHLDSLNLSQLELSGPSMQILAPDTSEITVSDITARLSVHLHPTPAAAAAAGTPYERIVIDELRLGRVAASGMRIHLASLDLWLDLPESEPFTVGPVLVGRPADPATNEPLEIVPSAGGTAITGIVRAEALHTERLQAQLVGSLNARMAFDADVLQANLAGDGPMSIDLLNWSATQIVGYVMGDPDQRIRVRRGAGGTRHDMFGEGTGIGGDRLSYNAAEGGHVTLAGLNARGLRYDDEGAGIHLDIRRIESPQVAVDLGGNNQGRRVIEIPSATITDAWFRIDPIPSGGGSGSGATASRYLAGDAGAAWLAANHELFSHVNGSFTLAGAYGIDGALGIPSLDYTFGVNVPITNGSINYADLEGQIPNLADALVDFHLEGSTLFIGAGFHFYPPGDPEGMGPTPEPIPIYHDFFEWNLEGNHLREAEAGRIDLETLLRARSPRAPSASSDSGGTDYAAPLRIDRLALALGLDNGSDLTVSLGSIGTATLAPHALGGLTVTGALQPLDPIFNAYPSLRRQGITNPERPGALAVRLDHFDLSALDLRFPTRGRGSRDVRTGAVHIGRIADAEIGFAGLTPRTAEGTLSEASVTNLIVTLNPDQVCPVPETPAPRRAGAPALDTAGEFRSLDANGRPREDRP
jgi:hypothetical protein